MTRISTDDQRPRGRTTRGAVATVTAVAAVALGSVAVTGSTASPASASARQITGTWAVTVEPDGPPPGFVSTIVYTATGSVVEATSNRPPSAVTAGLGTWERLGDGRFSTRMLKYRFDGPTYVGTTVIVETSEVAPSGDSYTSRATTTLYDAAGVARGTFSSSVTAERL